MTITLNNITAVYPEQLILEIDPQTKAEIWQSVQDQSYSSSQAMDNAFLNCLCLQIITDFCRSELEDDLEIWRSSELASFWSIVTGSAILVNNYRLILLPTQSDLNTSLQVPREWLEIASWVGDYYLSIEVDLEQNWLRVCGYSTYEQIKQQGQYDRLNETYTLEAEELIEDINVLWTVLECYELPQLEIAALPALDATQAGELLLKLSDSAILFPRLALPFEQWSRFIANHNLRQELDQKRRSAEPVQEATKIINLSQWLNNTISDRWQSLQDMLNENESLAYNFRNFGRPQSSQQIEKVKILNLELEQETLQVALLIGITSEEDNRMTMRIQLHPIQNNNYLPFNIQLALETNSGKVIQSTNARHQDQLIQLKKFTCPLGQKFNIRVTLQDCTIAESFTTG